MIIHAASHLDHALTPAQIAYVLARYEGRAEFLRETIELPDDLGTVPCGLYGPLMGDAPITADEAYRTVRGERMYQSRCVARPTRPTRLLTVIAGPHDGHACVLYTAFGGPLAPQEPGDPTCRDVPASTAFWSAHALAAEVTP